MNALVLKLGGSVLVDIGACAQLVHEVYRHYRSGLSVLVVCSAFKEHTDALLNTASEVNHRSNSHSTAALVQTGEQQAAACLALACDAAGVPARLLDSSQIGLRAEGNPLDAVPVDVRTSVLRDALTQCSVVIVPGYCARDAAGNPVLLGRGGSDLTAVFLAAKLGVPCHLVKDVDGWYDGERRFDTLSFADALVRRDPVVQVKAVEYAAQTDAGFTIGLPSSQHRTTVGNVATRYASPLPQEPDKLRVSILGVGTVGTGVWQRLSAQTGFEIVGGLVRSTKSTDRSTHGRCSNRRQWIDSGKLTTDVNELFDCDIIVEALPNAAIALPLIKRALRSGTHVVTANKDLVARYGPELEALALASGASFEYSAAVGGACPTLEAAERLSGVGQISRMRGILNATTNVVLDAVSSGESLRDAVSYAQKSGFAEADPSGDLSGRDAANKLVLVVRKLTGIWIASDSIDTDPLTDTASASADNLRQVAQIDIQRSRDGRVADVRARVSLEPLQEYDPLAGVRADWNGAVFYGGADGVDTTKVVGRGAGRWPTSEAAVADVLSVANSISAKHHQVLVA